MSYQGFDVVRLGPNRIVIARGDFAVVVDDNLALDLAADARQLSIRLEEVAWPSEVAE